MSPSKSHKSRSGSVPDSDSESSIEDVQIQSPSSPNIPLTTPIASSINVSGLNIDGPEGTPQISSNTNPQSKFPREFLLNPGRNPVASQDPFGQSKQPTLNIPSGSQVHVGNERRVDGGRRKRPLENVTWSGLLEGNPGLTLHQSKSF
ncbi:hypothetical protein O181_100803 [Austropuccinia psidii MF-1]|uniref:Uncharacterized protein n=1 Tax=Austropuccinia psidii MF-1 TaxID=1389203 RepID=A0A9Q3JFA4_9BASI|nr:hypothetical protein [Austropuccinia psidii MF-1]